MKNNDDEYYINLVNSRNIIHGEITSALEIVKKFIIENNLILVGGMAIDFALRLKGDNIYTDDQIPDYDFYSPNHSEDAYRLGVILCKAGFSNVSCINAIHITTMKVRVDFEVVADITYCPLKIYNNIPVLLYDKLRIVHPHWQMTDQHSSLALPFENPGREVIFHRWRKDMLRYDKLYEYYPVVPVLKERENPFDPESERENPTKTPLTRNTKSYNIKGGLVFRRTMERELLAETLELPIQTVKIPLEKLSGSCICGWSAVDYKIEGDYIILSIPTGENITLASYNYNKFIEHHNLKILEYCSEYFGKLTRKVICKTDIKDGRGLHKKMEIYDIFGTLVSAKKISEKYDVYVCNLQYAMMYLLIRVFSSTDPRIVFTAEEQYVRCRQLVIGGEHPSIQVYGKYNFTHSYLNSMKINKERTYTIKSKQLQPANMYPKPPQCINDKSFDPETSEYFMTDARKMESFIEWTLDPYPEYNINTRRGNSG